MGDTVTLAASVMVRNEMGRYLAPFVEHLEAFCDVIVCVDDCSDDGSWEYLSGRPSVVVARNRISEFFTHEGRARQKLLALTLKQRPTHVLAIDADEFVSDGQQLRDLPASASGVWSVRIAEVWQADSDRLRIRHDGGWVPHAVSLVYRPPRSMSTAWRINQRKLACGRVPVAVETAAAAKTTATVLHFGWADQSDRDRRYQRYATHDGGVYHAGDHLRSIMWPDSHPGLRLRDEPWPDALAGFRERLLR